MNCEDTDVKFKFFRNRLRIKAIDHGINSTKTMCLYATDQDKRGRRYGYYHLSLQPCNQAFGVDIWVNSSKEGKFIMNEKDNSEGSPPHSGHIHVKGSGASYEMKVNG